MHNIHQSVVDLVRARIGTTLNDKWRIDELLGLGGMAAVYAATHRTGSRVAIKMLHPQLSLNDAVRKRFAREGYVGNTVGHPGVARVLDDDVAEDGSVFLVMELLEGETAAARAERLGGRLPVHEAAFIGEAVAEVLAAAHANGVIHRDIKPDNVFITNEGRVVVLDFGIARVADASGISDAGTRTGTMMGTPAFMPPEQARGRANEMDATSDVWALGSTLFWLLSGRVVHPAETPNEQLVAAATLPAPSLARVAPDVPTPLVLVIDHALQYAKENRFPDAVAMQRALHQAILDISWGPDVRPGLVLAKPGVVAPAHVSGSGPFPAALASGKYRPLAAQLPLAGSDDADTVADNAPPIATFTSDGGRGPTFGPVEVAGKGGGRATKFLLAGAIGALAAGLALTGVFFLRRDARPVAAIASALVASSVGAAPPPVSPSAAEPREPPAETVAVAPSVSAAPSASSASGAVASGAHHAGALTPPTSGKKSWLDRRK